MINNRQNILLTIAIVISLMAAVSCAKSWERNSPFDPGRGEATITATPTPLIPTFTSTPTYTPRLIHGMDMPFNTSATMWETWTVTSRHTLVKNTFFSMDVSGRLYATFSPKSTVGTSYYLADIFLTMPVNVNQRYWQFVDANMMLEPAEAFINSDIDVYFYLALSDGDEFFGRIDPDPNTTIARVRVHLGTDDLTAGAGNVHSDIRTDSANISNVGFRIDAGAGVNSYSDSITLSIRDLRFY